MSTLTVPVTPSNIPALARAISTSLTRNDARHRPFSFVIPHDEWDTTIHGVRAAGQHLTLDTSDGPLNLGPGDTLTLDPVRLSDMWGVPADLEPPF